MAEIWLEENFITRALDSKVWSTFVDSNLGQIGRRQSGIEQVGIVLRMRECSCLYGPYAR